MIAARWDLPNAHFALGRIAKTTGWATGWGNRGSIEVVSNDPLVINGENSQPVEWEELDKIGQETGWTYGQVSDKICFDTPVNWSPYDRDPDNIVIRCSHHVANGYADKGDSGAPVFKWQGYTNPIILHGVLWGTVDAGFVYSAMDLIRLDLGLSTSATGDSGLRTH